MFGEGPFLFQHGCAKSMKAWFDEFHVEELQWPAFLNIGMNGSSDILIQHGLTNALLTERANIENVNSYSQVYYKNLVEIHPRGVKAMTAGDNINANGFQNKMSSKFL